MAGRRVIQDSDDDEESNIDDPVIENVALPIDGGAEALTSPSPSAQLQSEDHHSKRQKTGRHGKERGSSVFIRSSSEVYESPRKVDTEYEWDIPSSAPVSGSTGAKARSRNALRDSAIEIETPTATRFREAEDGYVKKGRKEKGKRSEDRVADQEAIDNPRIPKQSFTINIPIVRQQYGIQPCEPDGEIMGSDPRTIDPAKLVNKLEELETVDMVDNCNTEDLSSNQVEESIEQAPDRHRVKQTKKKSRGKTSSIKSSREDNAIEPGQTPRVDISNLLELPCEQDLRPSKKRKRSGKADSQDSVGGAISSQQNMDQSSIPFAEDHSRAGEEGIQISQDLMEKSVGEGLPNLSSQEESVKLNNEALVHEESEPEVTMKKSKRGRKAKKPKRSKRSKAKPTLELDQKEDIDDKKDCGESHCINVDRDSTPVVGQNGALSEVTPNTSPKKTYQLDDNNVPGNTMTATGLQTPKKQTLSGPGSHSPINSGKVPYRVGLSKSARIQPLLRIVKK